MRLSIMSLGYGTTLLIGYYIYCLISIYQCRYGQNIILTDKIIMMIILFCIIYIIGLLISSLIVFIYLTIRLKGLFGFTILLLFGALLGLVPGLFILGVQKIIYGHLYSFYIDYLPFLFSGTVIAIICPYSFEKIKESRQYS